MYEARLMTPRSWRTITGTSLPSVVLVVAMSPGRAPAGSNAFQLLALSR
jgi:hypothetical protein